VADQSFSATVAASGTAVVTIRVPSRTRKWVITQLSGEIDDAAAPLLARVDKNGYLVSNFIARGDTLAGEPPVTLLSSDTLTVTWENCTPGKVAQVFIFYDEVRV